MPRSEQNRVGGSRTEGPGGREPPPRYRFCPERGVEWFLLGL